MKRCHSRTLLASVLLLCAAGPDALFAADFANLDQAVREAAKYEPGQSKESLRALEKLVRQSAGDRARQRELDAALAKLLAPETTYEAKRFACTQLAIVGGEQSLAVLAGLLAAENTATIACQALATHPSPKANDVLRNALASSRGPTRLQIVNTLGDRRDAGSVKLLAGLARDPDAALAGAALMALGKIATPAAVKEITASRKAAAPAVQSAVTEALLLVAGRLASAGARGDARGIYEELLKSSHPTFVRRAAFAGLLRLDSDSGEARVLKTLHGADTALKPVAIAAIQSLPGKGVSARFAAEMPKLTAPEQVWLIESLAARADPNARAAVAGQLNSTDAAVRIAAMKAMGGQGDAAAVPPLTRALTRATVPAEREAAGLALTTLRGGEATDQAIVTELRQAPAATKPDLIAVLSRRANPAVMPALLNEAGSAEASVARAAFIALGSLATPAELPALVDRLVDLKAPDARAEAEGAVAQVVARITEVSERSGVVRARLATATNVDARCSLLRVLSSAGDAAALGALNTAKADANPVIRDTAIRTLAQWPDTSAWESLAAVMNQPEQEAHRVLALRGLVRLAGDENARPSPSLVERYKQVLTGAKSDDDRKLILGALGNCNHPDALQLAVSQLGNAGVRAEAELAVKRIAEAIKAQHPQAAQDALQKLSAR